MTPAPLKFVSEKVAADLFGSIEENIDRYLEGDFSDLARELGWALETRSVEFDSGFADDLIAESGKEAEIANSMLVFDALKGMTPAVARDERIWVRLCHIEALVYARKRWIGASDPARDVRNHFLPPDYRSVAMIMHSAVSGGTVISLKLSIRRIQKRYLSKFSRGRTFDSSL